jgi:DNA-directed RNA polymerase specialized sigma24 family protein
MSSAGSVSHWLGRLKAGDPLAAQHLWEPYYRQLVHHARHKLQGAPRRAADEEDVALSAFDSFCRAAAQGRFPQLLDRQDLWQLLVLIADRKACDLVHYERRQRRGGGQVLDEAALAAPDARDLCASLAELPGPEPSPALVAQVAEQCQRLLHALGDPELQQIAVRKLEGYTVEEIAAQQGLVPRTVQRRLRLIRRIWEQELPA